MVENVLIVKNASFDNEDSTHQETNTPPLNTDDDESISVDGSQQPLENVSKISQSQFVTESTQPEKIKKKKQRPTEPTNGNEPKKRSSRKRSWYTKIDLVKPIIFITSLLLIYLIWVNRDVLIVRLLTSNARVRHTAIMMEHILHEEVDLSQGSSIKESSSTVSSASSSSPSSTSTASSSPSSPEDEIIGGNNDNINDNNNDNINHDQSFLTDNDDDSPKVTSKHSSSQKINIRTRRNKMSFSKERPKKKNHRLQHRTIDDDNTNDDVGGGDDDDDDDGDDNDNDDVLEDNIDKIVINPSKIKDPILPSTIHSSKKYHHKRRRSAASHEENQKGPVSSKANSILPVNEDIVEQLRKVIKAQGGQRDFTKALSKATGLNEAKINRFIHDKDYSVMTLHTFIALLNSFDTTLLILSK
ncbi:unnamed protein product [Rotaria magnacalcarata]|uniref:Uncharacterized protein n=1 Tax=Rotaria magnacalcarata TaxID=392030 RepID=A0A814MIS8_9BILA|nr:unnamed protein product [Rotaria magnacalcarata]CAF1579848.1 unnamed protein product [Rotaria magnacalcarata]CAF2052901.1 unnamed protein product [Rotaria magnacalcarata]CAF4072228.1 unnamed protein product [Rotaria magnacalcarata]CAF4162150.1 unnamed protein product [Rotaria magnacalcarata]